MPEINKIHAYATDGPEAIAAYRAARAARTEFSSRLLAAAAALGGNIGPVSGPQGFGGPEVIYGLMPDGSGTTPAGWRIVSRGTSKRLEPATGAAGKNAVRWLAAFQPPPEVDPLYVLKAHGLAYQSRTRRAGGGHNTHSPIVFEHRGKLWAGYLGQPDGDFPGEPSGLTWDEVPWQDYMRAKVGRELADTRAGR